MTKRVANNLPSKTGNVDDLLRIADANAKDASSADKLLNKPSGDLFSMLALTIATPNASAGVADDKYRTRFSDNEDFVRNEKLEALGKRIFMRWSQTIHQFVCSSESEDKALKQQIFTVMAGKRAIGGGGAAVIAGALVAAFGISPAIAALVAALLLQLIIAPAADELCKYWGQYNESSIKKANLQS